MVAGVYSMVASAATNCSIQRNFPKGVVLRYCLLAALAFVVVTGSSASEALALPHAHHGPCPPNENGANYGIAGHEGGVCMDGLPYVAQLSV